MNNRLRVEEAKKRIQERLSARFEGKRQTATATVSSVERDPVSQHTTGKVRATIDGVADQSVFVGAGTGVSVGDSLRVENRAGGIGPEWVSLGKTGSVAGSEGNVDTGRPLSTPSGLGLATDVYSAANGATVLANITATWNQIGDWEGVSHYEVEYYLDTDGATKAHVSRAPHVNGNTTVSYTVLNLLPGVSYNVRVRAVGYGGSLSSWTAYSTTATATDPSAPSTPSGLSAAQLSDTALRFYWTANTEADFAYYEIGVSGTAGAPLLSGYPLSTGDTPEHIINVDPETDRYFRVRAIDTTGNASAWSSFSGPHSTAETVSGYLDLAEIIDTSYGLGLQGSGKIGIDLASPSGLGFSSGDLQIDDSVAGAGLTISSKVLAVGAGNGISVAADSVAVDQAYSFTWTGTHTFQTNDVQMAVNLDFVGAQSITTTADNLTIAPAGDVILNPAGNQTIWTWGAGKSLESDDYASQTTGWGISYGSSGGHADFRSMYADELHVQAFIADIYQAIVGGLIITPGRARLSRDFTIPATSGTGTLYVEDNEGFEDAQVFASGDYVRLRHIDTSGGGLIVTDAWGTVSSYTNLTGGEQSWTFTTTDDGGVSGNQVYTGAIALGYGQSGAGVWEATVLDSAGSPYSQVQTWVTDPSNPANFTTHLRLGNLDGIGGVGLEYGLWAGQDTTETYVLLSDSSFEAHGLRLSLYEGGTERIRLDPSAPSFALGATLPAAYGNDGIWMGRHSDGTYRLSIEESAGDQYLRWTWDGSRYYLDIAGDIWLHDSPGAGGDDLGPTLTIDNYGEIDMGANSYITMGANSTFAAAAGSTFTIGTQGSGAYLSYSGGELIVEGQIIVTDGEDFLPIGYAPHLCDISVEASVNGTDVEMLARAPYGEGGDYGIVGQLVTKDGSQYWLQMAESEATPTDSRNVVFYVWKDHPIAGGIDDPTTYLGYSNVVLITPINQNLWDAISDKTPYVIVGRGYLSSDYETLESFSGIGEGSTTIITPDYIQTPSLSAISANLGSITAGTITVVNDTNTLWLNNGTNDIVLAAGSTAGGIANAAFKVWEDGRFAAGSATNYVSWDGATVWIKGTLRADAGYLSGVTVDGNLTMNGGQIRWNSNNSYIDNSKIVISEASGWSTTRIGDTAQTGLIDIDMFSGATGEWTHGIHITDGGNAQPSVSALYHAQTSIGADAVDRLFNAIANNSGTANTADGFYADIAGGTWNNWDSNGVAFKGETDTAPSVTVQRVGTGLAPTVWAKNSAGSAAIYSAVIGASSQTGLYIDNTLGGTNIVAVNANSTGIENVRFQRFVNLATSTPGAGDAGVPAAADTNEFIVYARQGALRMKNSQYEWVISTNTATAL